jgi:signal transduction histidine kinase
MATTEPMSRRLRVQTSFIEPDQVQVTVRDAGVGLKADELTRLFAPFYTTKPTGTGVGLSISRLIVDAHGGKIWAQPNDGRGTTFYVSIPIAADDTSEPATTGTHLGSYRPQRSQGRAERLGSTEPTC